MVSAAVYAVTVQAVADMLERAPARAQALAATYGAPVEAEELRAWMAYAVEDLRRLNNMMNEETK